MGWFFLCLKTLFIIVLNNKVFLLYLSLINCYLMGIWENTVIGRYFGTQKQTMVIDDSVVNMEGDALSIDAFIIGKSGGSYYKDSEDFVKLQDENFVLNNVIGTIAKKFSNAVFTDEKDSKLLFKLNNPNNDQSKEEFLTEFAIYILSSGYTVIWKDWKSYGNIDTLQLKNINPDTVEFKKGDKVSFEYANEAVTVDLKEVVCFYDTRRNSKTKKGFSRIAPLKSQVENVSLAQKAKNIQIQNSGTTIVSPKQVGAGNTIDEGLNAPVPQMGGNLITQKEEMEQRLNNRSLENRIIVSSKGLDAVNLSEKLNGIDFNKIVEQDALVIYDAYNFPIELSPYGKTSTFDNKQTAELALLESEIFPLANNLVNSLNAEFEKKIATVAVNYNQLGIMSIVENRIIDTNAKIIDQYSKLLADGVIDAAEYKAILIENNILHEKARK